MLGNNDTALQAAADEACLCSAGWTKLNYRAGAYYAYPMKRRPIAMNRRSKINSTEVSGANLSAR